MIKKVMPESQTTIGNDPHARMDSSFDLLMMNNKESKTVKDTLIQAPQSEEPSIANP
jgi:hypothetical protein